MQDPEIKAGQAFKVLVVDDEEGVRDLLTETFQSMGIAVTCAASVKSGVEKAFTGEFDVIFLDVRLPDGDGIEALQRIQKIADPPETIIITAYGDPDAAELAIKSGAWDYLQKPLSINQTRLTIKQALQYREKKMASKQRAILKRCGIIGESPQISQCLDFVSRAANSDANVLIMGETGTGKELFARAIHENSARSDNNYIAVDCTALPDTLVESLLFGHVKGAFTGADKSREGLLKQADGGTLFLDEVGEMPLSLQPTFLRALQERVFRQVGGNREIASRFRLIAVTNRNLEKEVEEGRFREDLLFRLQTMTLTLPPLRKRKEDIDDICMHCIRELCEDRGLSAKGISQECIKALAAYSWAGNVRELLNVLEEAVTNAYDEPMLNPIHLPQKLRIHYAQASLQSKEAKALTSPAGGGAPGQILKLREMSELMEEEYFKDVVSATKGDVPEMCRVTGLSRASLYKRLKKYKISLKR